MSWTEQESLPSLRSDVWCSAGTGSEPVWDVSRLQDEAYCREWKLAAGGVEMLNSPGTRQGENTRRRQAPRCSFWTLQYLKDCIIDLPGFGTETENDDVITLRRRRPSDVIIYLSQGDRLHAD